MRGDMCLFDHGPDPVVVDDSALEKMVKIPEKPSSHNFRYVEEFMTSNIKQKLCLLASRRLDITHPIRLHQEWTPFLRLHLLDRDRSKVCELKWLNIEEDFTAMF